MKKKIIITISLLCCLLIGFFVGKFLLFPAEVNAAVQNGKEMVNRYFDTAVYVGQLIADDETSPLRYSSGDWEIQTDSKGEKILSISLKADVAEKAEKAIKKALSVKEIEEIATEELKRFVDIKYHLESTIKREGRLYTVDLYEKRNGKRTGAAGTFVYFADGKLFSMSYSERIMEDYDDDKLLSLEEAYKIAYDAIVEKRPDLTFEYSFDKEKVVETYYESTQAYLFKMTGKTASGEDRYGECFMYATDGSIIDFAFEDY